MPVVNDINRPDVGGIPPKMQAIADMLIAAEISLPFLKIVTDDNLCSSVSIIGSLERKEDWSYGIFQNSPHFNLQLTSKAGRYYSEGDMVTAEILTSSKLSSKFRKYSSTPEKVVAKILIWIGQLTKEEGAK